MHVIIICSLYVVFFLAKASLNHSKLLYIVLSLADIYTIQLESLDNSLESMHQL